MTHTHKHRTHTPPTPSTQSIPIQGYMATTLACASLHPSMHNTSIFKEGIEEIEDGDHTTLENAGPFGSRMMWRRLTDSSTPSLPRKITNPSLPRIKWSTHEILPLSSMFFQLSHQTCCLFSFNVYRIPMHTHLTYITCLHLSHRPNFFLSLSLSISPSVLLGLSPTLSATYIQSFPPYLLDLRKLSLHVSFPHWDVFKMLLLWWMM